MLKSQTTKKSKYLYTKSVKEVLSDEPKTDTKSLKRLKIQDEVFDDKDAIADNAKILSLFLSMFNKVWATLPQSQKDTMDPLDVQMIDYFKTKFDSTNTNADYIFQTEGVELINRLLDRQADIGIILHGEKQ